MKNWLRRIRGAVGMGLTWAVEWALFGILIGVASKLFPFLPWWDAFFKIFDAPLPAFAIPGFIGGIIFSVVLGVAGRRRRFHELSLPKFTAWGAVGGLLLSLVPAAMVFVGFAEINPGYPGVWQLTAFISTPLTLMSAASAAGSLKLAQMGERREDGDDVGLAKAETRDLLEAGDPTLYQRPAAKSEARVRRDRASGSRDA